MTIAAEPKTIFWLLEGVTDIRFFKPRIGGDTSLIDCNGKYKLIEVVKRINSSKTLQNIRAMGIVDNDYDWLTGYLLPDNVISTEPRDLEGVLLRANCIENVLAEYADANAVRHFTKMNGSVVDAVLSRAMIFGKIRAANSLTAKVSLKEFKPIQFFRENWTYDEDAALARAVRLGVCSSLEDLRAVIANLPEVPAWHYVRGHDAVDILCGGLRSVLGGRKGVCAAHIEPVLRQSFSDEDYLKTEIYRSSKLWHEQKGLEYPCRLYP
ncbi:MULTISPECIES: DUF4435 domain-containing protein [unclassified Pseudomonas]|uniref:DUF4435 domain-containing protein n=1 Tax=unclassified Pseudomonas TaxID=196821 RepID=UPI00148384E9|nr:MULTISPECIES: DUF4435 domain-containing protein [unclassified Pseudomonas]NKF24847.1 DUF4435 domain-containing protein [Pseudomonas sp. BG5]